MFVEDKEKYFVTTYTSLWFSNHEDTLTEPFEKAYIRTESIHIYRVKKFTYPSVYMIFYKHCQ